MKRTGKKTAHPGVLRIGKNSYQVRATAKCPKTRKRYEKERRIHDVSLAKALDIQNAMRLQLEAFVEEQAAANDNTITPVRRQGQLAEDMTFTEYAEKWLLHVERAGRKRPHVVDGDIIKLESMVLPLLGDLYISEIGKPELALWMNKITQLKKPNGEPYAKNTLHSGWRLLASMLRDAETSSASRTMGRTICASVWWRRRRGQKTRSPATSWSASCAPPTLRALTSARCSGSLARRGCVLANWPGSPGTTSTSTKASSTCGGRW